MSWRQAWTSSRRPSRLRATPSSRRSMVWADAPVASTTASSVDATSRRLILPPAGDVPAVLFRLCYRRHGARRRAASMSGLRVGIVGLGWAAGAHIETFKHVRGAAVTAVCSRRRRDPAELERKYGQPLTAYIAYERMLHDDTIDIIDICSPPWLHARQAIAAARVGKHVLLEKPIALAWDDA